MNDVGNWLGSMVTRARLHYTRYYLTPGICSPITPAVMEKVMPFPDKIRTVILQLLHFHYHVNKK